MFSLGNGEPSFKVLNNMLGEDARLLKRISIYPSDLAFKVTIYQVR
ncbi:hypothetical protein [Vibrio phage J14]|nr:hypothetical protein [Vibrio phage J14]